MLSKSITGEKEEMMNNVVHPRVVDSAVTDFRNKAPQKERQTEIKNDSDLSKGLSNSANILPTSHVLLPLNLSSDVNESATKWNPPKEKPESVATDFKYGEIEDLKMDATADTATEVLKNSQEDDGTPRLDIVTNYTLDGIATQTEIVDDQKSSVISTNKGRSSLCRANEVGETAVNLVADTNVENETAWAKSGFSSPNDWNSTPTTIETEKLFIISQQVEFTVKSVSTLSDDVKEDVNRPGSCSNESGLLLEKGFIIPTELQAQATISQRSPDHPKDNHFHDHFGFLLDAALHHSIFTSQLFA
ncbi:unnamed protein product [Acanthosepion pharaonis]|uniref:Uncharacterized protein n=1 Tax=Acanthosepion pharaonis TaxID=158019 RepID=A0A812DFJ1_ACAPH|nr:unnamed protein product [Sepia pharaonis]